MASQGNFERIKCVVPFFGKIVQSLAEAAPWSEQTPVYRCTSSLVWQFFLPNRHGGFLKSWNRGTPESSILIWFNMIFHYKPSILRITHLWMDTPICCIILPHISVRPEDHSEAGGFWVAMVRGNLRVRFVWVDLMMNIRNVCNEPYFGASRSTSLIWHNSNFSWFVEDHSADCNWFPPRLSKSPFFVAYPIYRSSKLDISVIPETKSRLESISIIPVLGQNPSS
jgi:hypothetical protein